MNIFAYKTGYSPELQYWHAYELRRPRDLAVLH
jgi:hypothetical protein